MTSLVMGQFSLTLALVWLASFFFFLVFPQVMHCLKCPMVRMDDGAILSILVPASLGHVYACLPIKDMYMQCV